MKDYMTIGSVPVCEDCIPFNKDGHYEQCKKFLMMMREKYINIPENSYFRIKENLQDSGSYFEVAVYWDDKDEESTEFAFYIESNSPQFWNETEIVDWNQVKTEKQLSEV